MRLLFLSNLYPPVYVGGYEQICFDLAQQLKRRGHEVRVLTSAFRASDAGRGEAGVYRSLRLKRGWDAPGTAPGLAALLASLGVQRHNVRVVRRTIARLRPDAVMVWNANHLGYPTLLAAEERAPVVYYLHDTWLAGLLARYRSGRPTAR